MASQRSEDASFSRLLGVPTEIIKLAEGDVGCPHLIYCVWKSGRHAIMRLTCKSWRCGDCSQVKITQMTQALADVTTSNEILYEVTTDHKQQENVTKYLRRRKISALSIKFTNSFYVVADQEAVGKEWQSNPISRFDAIIKVHSVDRLLIKRRDFLQDWKPESTYEPKRDTVVISRKFTNLREARQTLERFGQDLNSDLVNGDPFELMEVMLAEQAAITLELGR